MPVDQQARPLLSASLIVRNEERVLDACLSSIAPVVDEIIVVDTGSTDRTVAIAAALLRNHGQVVLWAWMALVLASSWAAGFLVRLFMIQHDCGHGSFFRHRLANDWVGRAMTGDLGESSYPLRPQF